MREIICSIFGHKLTLLSSIRTTSAEFRYMRCPRCGHKELHIRDIATKLEQEGEGVCQKEA
jgi:DNA-directed RNA polymerase subunit RPC12/RpoP